MKFVLAAYGSRGDVEPCAVVGRELRRRGHDVRIAVPPNMVAFAESVGLDVMAYGPDSHAQLDTAADFFVGNMKNPYAALPQVVERVTKVWVDKGTALPACQDLRGTPASGAGPAGGARARAGVDGDPGLRRTVLAGAA